MEWSAPTYSSAYRSGALNALDALEIEVRHGELRVRCECGILASPFVILDIRAISIPFAVNRKWACDGCWTRWERQSLDCADGRSFDESVFYELLGAPASVLTKLRLAMARRKERFTDL